MDLRMKEFPCFMMMVCEFLRRKHDEYDLIINDSTDPLGHTEGLFTKEFYGSCYKALKDDGIMVYQHGSPFL